MTVSVGLELNENRIRAVTVNRWSRAPHETFEILWDPRAPRDAVALLRKQLGEASTIGIAVGLSFMHAKNVQLPPVSSHERRGILALEPDRFFAIDSSEIAVSVQDNSDFVFAADASTVESWIAAFEEWAPVVAVEPSPSALRRALSTTGSRSGVFEIPSGEAESELVEIKDGVVVAARRVDKVTAGSNSRPLPSIRGVPAEFLVAYGVTLGANAPLDEMLLPASVLQRTRNRRRATLARACANFALALAFAIAALDRSRTRVLEREREEIAALEPRVASPAAMQARLAQLDLESSAARSAGTAHANPLAVLGAISRRLPHDAVVMSLRADGDEWQIDGTTRDAAAILPALDADPMLESVRFLSASSRFNEGNRTYETFAVGLHARR